MAAMFNLGIGARRRIGEMGDFDLIAGSFSSDPKRLTLTADGFAPAGGGERAVTHFAALAFAGGTAGRIMQGAATYQVALPLDDASAPHASGDPLHVTPSVGSDTILYPGDHSVASIFAGDGKGLRLVRDGSGLNQYRWPNAKLTGLSSGQVLRQHALLCIEASAAGTIALRAYGGLTTTVQFTHDASGRITGEDSNWASQRAGWFNFPYLINGKQWCYVWADRVTTGSGDIDFGLDIIAGAGASALHVCSFAAQVSPADSPSAVPVTQPGSYVADSLDTGIIAEVGYVLHGADVARSALPGGVIETPAVAVGVRSLPICTRIEIVALAGQTEDRTGLMANPQIGYAQRPWRSPAALNLIYGPCRIPRQFVRVASTGDNVTNVTVRSVFDRLDKRCILGNTTTSATFLAGNLDVSGCVLMAQGDASVSEYYRQPSIRASGGSFDLRATGDVIAEGNLCFGATLWPTRAWFEEWQDMGGVDRRVYVGEFRHASSGGLLSTRGSRFERYARVQFGGIGNDSLLEVDYTGCAFTRYWMDGPYFQGGTYTRIARDDLLFGVCTAPMSFRSVDSSRAIQISTDGGASFADLDFDEHPLESLPCGILCRKIGTWDGTSFTPDPDPDRILPVAYYYPSSLTGGRVAKPGYQFIIDQIDEGNHTKMPLSGEVFEYRSGDLVLQFTPENGRWLESGYQVQGAFGSVVPGLGNTASPDAQQFNRTNVTVLGPVANFTAEHWYIVARGTGNFSAGSTFRNGLPTEAGSRFGDLEVRYAIYMADRKRDPVAHHWSAELDSVLRLENWIAVELSSKYTLSGGAEVTMSYGVAGPYNTVDLNNVLALTSHPTGLRTSGGGTFTGTLTHIPLGRRFNFSEFDIPTDESARAFFPAEFWLESEFRPRAMTLEDIYAFRFTAAGISAMGWDANATIVRCIGEHPRWEPVIADLAAKYHQVPAARAVVAANAAAGTVLATGLTGHLNHYYSGDPEQRYEIVSGELRTRRALTGLADQIDMVLTSTGELVIVDIIPNAPAAPVIVSAGYDGSPTDEGIINFFWEIEAFPAPVVTLQPFLGATPLGDAFEVGAVGEEYELDFAALGVEVGDTVIFRLTATNSAGSDTADIPVILEEPGVITLIGSFTRSSSSSVTATTIDIAAALPEAQIGDCIVVLAVSNSTGNEHAAPAGWTRAQVGGPYSLHRINSWDGTNPTFTTASSAVHGFLVIVARGAEFGASSPFSSTEADPTPAAITVPANNSLAFQAVASTGVPVTWNTPAGFTALAASSTNRSRAGFVRDGTVPSGTLAGVTMTRASGTNTGRGIQWSLSPK